MTVHYIDVHKNMRRIQDLIQAAKDNAAPKMLPEGYRELGAGMITQDGDLVYKDGSWQDTIQELVDGFHVFLRPLDQEQPARHRIVEEENPVTGLDMDDFLRL